MSTINRVREKTTVFLESGSWTSPASACDGRLVGAGAGGGGGGPGAGSAGGDTVIGNGQTTNTFPGTPGGPSGNAAPWGGQVSQVQGSLALGNQNRLGPNGGTTVCSAQTVEIVPNSVYTVNVGVGGSGSGSGGNGRNGFLFIEYNDSED